jgi:uncharacterized membrane protein
VPTQTPNNPPQSGANQQQAQSADPASATPILGPLPGTIIFPTFPGLAPGAPGQLSLPFVQRQQVQVQVWQGQFPPPEAIREYENIQPGAFNRMITMAEEAQKAQISSLQRAQEYQRRDAKRGHLLGAAISLVAMGLSVYCAIHGQSVVAGLLLSVPVMAVARSLIEGVKREQQQPPPTQPPQQGGTHGGKAD